MEKNRHTAFTLVELMMVIGIIAVLVGILMPAIHMVRTTTRITKQKGQFMTMDMAILGYKNDFGDYPPSSHIANPPPEYLCGSQKLVEALVGFDLMGFHPDSRWDVTDLIGGSATEPKLYVDYTNPTVYPPCPQGTTFETYNLPRRKSPYLDVSSANAFKAQDIFEQVPGPFAQLNFRDTYLFCDAFPKKKIVTGNVVAMAGTPILYYKANTSSMVSMLPGYTNSYINYRYNFFDNDKMIQLNFALNPSVPIKFIKFRDRTFYSEDYKIIDRQIWESTGGSTGSSTRYWPHRPDSYILISAGPDGMYGTADDITNYN